MIPRVSTIRRVKADRWIASLTPMFEIIARKKKTLALGEPMLDAGPTLMRKELFEGGGDRIRKGVVWWVSGTNCGFHVDFCTWGIEIEAWTGERRVKATIQGKVTSATLERDLSVLFVAAGLTDLARTEEVRDQLFRKSGKKE